MKFDNDFKEIKIRHIVIMIFLTVVALIPVAMLLNKDGECNNTNKLTILIEMLFSAMIVFKLKPSKKNIKRLYVDFKSKLNMREIVLIILCLTCLKIGTSNILTDIAYIIGPNFAYWFIKNSSEVIKSRSDYWIVFIIEVFFTPFTDEIMFRNVLFKRISKKFNIYIGLIASSMIFSSLSFGNEMIGVFLLGIVNCMLYVKYENILIPMIIYFIDSIIGMVKIALFSQLGSKFVVLAFKDILLYATSGLGLFIVGIIFFVKFIKNNKVYLRESFNKSKSIEII